MRFFRGKKTRKHSEIIIDLQTTKLLAASEVHHLLVISGVDLGSLKTALLRMISPFPGFLYLFLEMALCLLVTGSEYLDICL